MARAGATKGDGVKSGDKEAVGDVKNICGEEGGTERVLLRTSKTTKLWASKGRRFVDTRHASTAAPLLPRSLGLVEGHVEARPSRTSRPPFLGSPQDLNSWRLRQPPLPENFPPPLSFPFLFLCFFEEFKT
ncbi:hypothetical protein H6P81_007566 [Aristolochia fimbriata]|uniref:Uncharacterized protein n=1 Tax=Aristolochia fimbriata TaxID=158543 RepID=A0AAV7F3Z7_ARIFI|nr:hypothetical protein H6P81_007566 [Aristolochia fimbriata]